MQQPRALTRRSFTTDQHLEALDNDMDTKDVQNADLMAKLDRIHWTLIGVALTTTGGIVILLLTQSLGR
jgi:hypothetical protein